MRMTQLRARRDDGFTLAELLVAMVIASAVIAVGLSLISQTFRVAASTQTRAELWGSMTNTSVQLIRDVNDGSKITVSEPKHLAVQVVRDGRCQTRDWLVDGDKLISTTTFYDAASCTGGSTERKVESIKGGLSSFEFTYFSAASIDTPLPAPVAPGVVNRVGWTMAATPTDATAVLKLESGAAFTGRGASTDGTGATQTPLAGFLSVITNTSGIEGVSAPVLSWNDATPELTQGWAVYRTSYPDGSDAASSTGWEQISYLRTATPAPGVMTYTDRTLPRGYTALYIVRATVPDGYGPSSNQVATGLRPSASAITSDGTPTSIALSWTAPVGTTGYDIYRTEGGATATSPVLYKRWDDIKGSATKTGTGSALRWSWTDTLPAGRAHTYSVVPVNRWERMATTSSQTASLPVGEALAKTYAGGTGTTQKVARDVSNVSNNFTVAAAPTTSLDLSSATSATDYGSNVTWTAAAWTGGGGATVTAATQSADQGVHRDRGWETERRGSAWEAVWPAETPRTAVLRKDTATEPDITYGYRTRTMNSSGASAWASEARILQRPAVPGAPAAVLSGLTTRQATVTAKTSPSATSWQVQKVTGPGSAAMGGVKAANGSRQVVYNELGHSSAHTWQSRSTNVAPTNVAGGGTSAWGATGGVTTDRLRVWLSDGSKTTRSISARVNNEGGNYANITVEGNSTQPSNGGGQMHTFDPLVHSTTYTLTARLTDGYNNVSYQDNIRTDELRVWLSDGSVSTRSISARVNNINGNSASVTVEGFQTQPSNGGGQLHTFDPLVHNTTYTLTARLTDGYNNVAYQDNIRTRALANPVISDGWSNTRRIDLTVSSPEGTPQIEIAGQGNRTGNGRYSWDPLRHATTYQAYASNSDGYNSVVIGPVAVATQRLGVSTPSCSASRDGQYAPTTVRFSSNGSLNRSSVYAGSAGYYGATATNSNSDGFNVVYASNDCGISVEARPLINGGASGTPSATCTQYIRAADGLFASTQGGAPSGTAYGAKESEYGVYRSGAIATSNLSCTMIRVYALSNIETGAYAGSWGVAVVWNQGGSGAS